MNKHTAEDFDVFEPTDAAPDPLLGKAETELNSARVSGDDSPEWRALLDRPMTFLLPDDLTKDVEQKRWTNATGTLREWINGQKVKAGRGPECGLSHHLERKAKGFFPIVFGASAGKERTAKAMVTQECMTLDIESGDFYLDAVERAAALGIACIAYTSFNDQTGKSQIERDKVLAWMDKAGREGDPTDDDVREWMEGRGTYRPEHVASVRIAVPYIHTPKGVMIEIAHDPLDKFRMVFPLNQPVEIGRIARKVRDGQDLYKRKLLGLAEKLGLVIDESCIDVSRAFYMPSHPPGRDNEIDVLRGRALTFDELPEGESSKRNAFEKAGAGAETDGREIAGMSAKAWAAKYAKRLEIARLIDMEAPDRVREDKGGILVIECPFDEWHGNAGEAADPGCHVRDADGDTGFVWQCKHNSCSAHDRLDMIHKAVADGWFDESCLVSDRYLVPLSDEELAEGEAAQIKGKRTSRKATTTAGHDDADADPEPETDESRFEPVRDWLPASYKIRGGTIWGPGKDDEEIPLCQMFDVIGRASNLAGDARAGRIICFVNENGTEVEATLSNADLIRDGGGGVLELLADAGMMLYVTRKSREPILNLFRQIHPKRHVPTVPRPGWVRDRGGVIMGYMCPTGDYIEATPGNPFRLATNATVRDRAAGGTLDGWKDAASAAFAEIPADAGATLPPNFHWVIGACAGFVGPLMALADVTGCGFNLSGEAARGKTTALLYGATVWATPYPTRGVFYPANSTANAVEVIAATASESHGALDDLAAMPRPQDISPVLYGVSGGSGKSRMAGISAAAGLGESAEFRTFMLLSSERTLKDTITAAGVEYRAGLSRRFPDVNVTAGARVSADVMTRIEGVQRNYGHAGPAFVRWLIAQGWHTKGHELKQRIGAVANTLAGAEAIPAQREAAKVFALVQVAGELACQAGLLPDSKKVEAAILTAWQTFGASDEGKATEGEASLLDGFRSWLVRAMPGQIVDADDLDAVSYRDRLGWFTDAQIILIADSINLKAMGLSGTRDGLVKALRDAGALDKPDPRNSYHTNLPREYGGGKVRNLRIDRVKLGLPPPPRMDGKPIVGE